MTLVQKQKNVKLLVSKIKKILKIIPNKKMKDIKKKTNMLWFS